MKSLSRAKEMELRQLLTRRDSLMDVKPDDIIRSLKEDKPEGTMVIGDYKIDLTKF